MFNKSRIMKDAWFYFNNGDEATFSAALKRSWADEKAYVEEQNEWNEEIATSEEVKAWNWACKKLGVQFDLTNAEKFRDVENARKDIWSGNTFAAGMKAVKLHITLIERMAA